MFVVCQHPSCNQPASSRVGGKYQGDWNGHTVVSCLAHTTHFINSPMFSGSPVYVGVLLRK